MFFNDGKMSRRMSNVEPLPCGNPRLWASAAPSDEGFEPRSHIWCTSQREKWQKRVGTRAAQETTWPTTHNALVQTRHDMTEKPEKSEIFSLTLGSEVLAQHALTCFDMLQPGGHWSGGSAPSAARRYAEKSEFQAWTSWSCDMLRHAATCCDMLRHAATSCWNTGSLSNASAMFTARYAKSLSIFTLSISVKGAYDALRRWKLLDRDLTEHGKYRSTIHTNVEWFYTLFFNL